MSERVKVKVTVVKSEHIPHATAYIGFLADGLPKAGEPIKLITCLQDSSTSTTLQTSVVLKKDYPVFYTKNSIYLVELLNPNPTEKEESSYTKQMREREAKAAEERARINKGIYTPNRNKK